MKKLGALALSAAILSSLAVSASAMVGLSYTAPYATPVIDGVMEDTWGVAEWTEIALPYDGVEDKTVFAARARLMHDDKYIYLCVEASDATLDPDGDCFEIYFDEDHCADVAYCDVTNQIQLMYDGTYKGGMNSLDAGDMVKEYVITTSENGFLLEVAIELINGIPAPDKAIGLEFMANNNDVDGTWIDALRWNVEQFAGDVAPYQSPECFGDLYCAEYVAPAEPEVDEPAVDAPVDAPAEAPVTADAGIVAAAAVMAIAAGVVLSKKH